MAKLLLKNVIFLMQKHLSSSASATQLSSSSYSSFTVDYLMKSCGLPLKSAIAASRKLRGFDENNLQRYDSVIHLLKSHGFDTAHISKMIQKYPILLNSYKVEENLKPKLEFLVDNGFSGPDLHKLMVSNPPILGRSLSDRIKPSLDYLRSFLGTEEGLKLAVKRDYRLLTNNLEATLQPNIDLLVKEGVPLNAVTNFLISHPRLMQPKVDRLVAALEFAKSILNMSHTDPTFLLAVLRMAGICSEETLTTKLDFYFNTVKLKTDDIISYPNLLSFAIETRIAPRHNVVKLLLSKKLLKEDAKIAKILTKSEDKFLSKYVTGCLQQVPSLLDMYNNDKAVKKIGLQLVHTENMDLKADKEKRGSE